MSLNILKCVVASLLLVLVGCRGAAPIYDVTSAPVVTNKPASAADVEKAILRAGATLGWQMAAHGSGKLDGVLVLRTHRAVVDIAYDAKNYSIKYKDSANLQYDSEGKTIHNNYNGWVQNLDKAIRAQLSNM